ncbi:MAG: AAA family ATPase, partial [Synergistaceae bacterium]|nr:AAA family ATPase [Synergistaceae bacterium]
MGILQYCTPRRDLLEDNINLGMFTASLDEVHRHYTDGSLRNPIYTDAEVFFQQATYVTTSMKRVFSDVFARLSGDTTATMLNRLETGFGGGKTHTLIACMHLARKGKTISSVVGDAIPETLLPEPGEVSVVAVAGEMTPVTMTKGARI